MSTRLIYLDDSSALTGHGTVLRVLDADDAGNVGLVLDETPFYPQGGGQPADRGTIASSSGTFMVVNHAARDGDWVIHRGTVDGQFAVGDACELNVDGAVRSNHTRLHTGGELICAALAEMNVRYPIRGAMHYPGQCKVVLDVALHEADRAQLLETLQRTVTQLIVADVPVAITHDCTFGERTSDAVMAGGMRYVSIGDLNRRPCLGTHTRSAAEIGNLKILGIKSRKGETRISYDIETT